MICNVSINSWFPALSFFNQLLRDCITPDVIRYWRLVLKSSTEVKYWCFQIVMKSSSWYIFRSWYWSWWLESFFYLNLVIVYNLITNRIIHAKTRLTHFVANPIFISIAQRNGNSMRSYVLFMSSFRAIH